VTTAIARVRDGWDRVDESLDAAANHLINSFVGMAVAGINLGVGAYLSVSIPANGLSASLAEMAFIVLISLSMVLSGFMLGWGDDV